MSKTYTLEELKKMKSKTNVERFKSTTEKDILEQSLSDPDTPYPSDEEIKEFSTPKTRGEKNGKEK